MSPYSSLCVPLFSRTYVSLFFFIRGGEVFSFEAARYFAALFCLRFCSPPVYLVLFAHLSHGGSRRRSPSSSFDFTCLRLAAARFSLDRDAALCSLSAVIFSRLCRLFFHFVRMLVRVLLSRGFLCVETFVSGFFTGKIFDKQNKFRRGRKKGERENFLSSPLEFFLSFEVFSERSFSLQPNPRSKSAAALGASCALLAFFFFPYLVSRCYRNCYSDRGIDVLFITFF